MRRIVKRDVNAYDKVSRYLFSEHEKKTAKIQIQKDHDEQARRDRIVAERDRITRTPKEQARRDRIVAEYDKKEGERIADEKRRYIENMEQRRLEREKNDRKIVYENKRTDRKIACDNMRIKKTRREFRPKKIPVESKKIRKRTTR